MKEKIYFSLNKDCVLVNGYCKSAVYDLSTGDIYALEELSSKMLNLCEKGFAIKQIAKNLNHSIDELIRHLDELKLLKIGNFNDVFILNKTEFKPLPIALDLI